MTDKSGAAFPVHPTSAPDIYNGEPGLTKREYFAAMAMQGLLAGGGAAPVDEFIDDAIKCADRLITKLSEETSGSTNE